MKTEISEYEKQACDFLHRNRITIAIVLSGTKTAPWDSGADDGVSDSRNHYKVTLQKGRTGSKRLTFDFWGSQADKEKGQDPTAYDVLACISSDGQCPETFRDFCADYGYDQDSRKAEQSFRKCSAFAKKLRAFFTEEEIEQLSEIR